VRASRSDGLRHAGVTTAQRPELPARASFVRRPTASRGARFTAKPCGTLGGGLDGAQQFPEKSTPEALPQDARKAHDDPISDLTDSTRSPSNFLRTFPTVVRRRKTAAMPAGIYRTCSDRRAPSIFLRGDRLASRLARTWPDLSALKQKAIRRSAATEARFAPFATPGTRLIGAEKPAGALDPVDR